MCACQYVGVASQILCVMEILMLSYRTVCRREADDEEYKIQMH